MWGNTRGWILSAVLAIAFAATVMVLQTAGTTPSGMTPAFAAKAASLEPISLPIRPDTIVPTPDECDAAEAYRQAIGQYTADPELYASGFTAEKVGRLTACDKLAEGTRCRNMTLFTHDPSQVLNFDREHEPLEAIRKVGEASAARALLALHQSDLPGASKYAEAAFSLGAKLFRERLNYDELEAGLAVMGAADRVLIRIAEAQKDAARVAQVKAFDAGRGQLAAAGGPIDDLRVITRNIDGDLSGSRAGDVFWLAQHSPERLWRVEACFQLARIHHNVGDHGRASDQRYAQMLLRRLAEGDTDPVVKLAAAKARDMTEAEYNKQ